MFNLGIKLLRPGFHSGQIAGVVGDDQVAGLVIKADAGLRFERPKALDGLFGNVGIVGDGVENADNAARVIVAAKNTGVRAVIDRFTGTDQNDMGSIFGQMASRGRANQSASNNNNIIDWHNYLL